MDQHYSDTDPFRTALRGLNSLFFSLADESTRDRGTLAALRKGVGEPGGWHPATAMVVHRAIGDVTLHRDDENVLFMTAALFSRHPVIVQREEGIYPPSLLRSLDLLMDAQDRTSADDRASIDRRVMALLNADQADIFHYLRHLISLFKSSGIAIDWSRLARDLRNWNRPDHRVQRQWARDWWGAPSWTVSEGAATPESAVSEAE